MSIKIGQVYQYVSTKEDPFSTPTFIRIIDIKTNKNGEEWVKYRYLHEREGGVLKEGVLDQTLSVKYFSGSYLLCPELSDLPQEDLPVSKVVRSAIEQLDME